VFYVFAKSKIFKQKF